MWVSIKVTGIASILILVIGLPLSIYLAKGTSRLRFFLEILVMIPLLLPPTVMGYFLLIIFGKSFILARWFGIRLLFTLNGAAVAAAISGFPLMVMSSRAAISDIDHRIEDAARTLGANEFEVFKDITIPLAKKGIIAGMLLGIARAFGEFGATLMVAGSIPGRTRTLSIALYDAVQNNQTNVGLGIVIILTAITVITVFLIHRLEKKGG